MLRRHDWPGNVRELQHVVEAAMVVCDGPEIRPEHLPAAVRQTRAAAQAATTAGHADARGTRARAHRRVLDAGTGIAARPPGARHQRAQPLPEAQGIRVAELIPATRGADERGQARTGSARRATCEVRRVEPGADEPGHDCRLIAQQRVPDLFVGLPVIVVRSGARSDECGAPRRRHGAVRPRTDCQMMLVQLLLGRHVRLGQVHLRPTRPRPTRSPRSSR